MAGRYGVTTEDEENPSPEQASRQTLQQTLQQTLRYTPLKVPTEVRWGPLGSARARWGRAEEAREREDS